MMMVDLNLLLTKIVLALIFHMGYYQEELNDHLKRLNQKTLLVAVSKTKPLEDILDLYSLGQRDFGRGEAFGLADRSGPVKGSQNFWLA